MAITYRCALAVVESIPFWVLSTAMRLLSRHESFEYFLRFFQRACGVCAFLASSGSHGVATPPFLPTLMVYSREVPLLGFRLVWRSYGLLLRRLRLYGRLQLRFFCRPCAVLPIWRCFPQFHDFRASLGTSVLS